MAPFPSPLAFAALIRFRVGLTIDVPAIAVLLCAMSVMASPAAPVSSAGVACGKISGAPVAPKHLQGAVDLVGCQVGPKEQDGHRRPSLVPAGETGGCAVRGPKNGQFLEQHLGVLG